MHEKKVKFCVISTHFFFAGDSEDILQSTREAIRELRANFIKLVTAIKKQLKDGVKFDDFKEEVIYDTPESTRDQCQLYFEKKGDKIGNSRTYDQLFIVLNDCWDYLSPSLLEHIILKYGGEELNLKVDEYLVHLEEFLNETNAEVFWKAQKPRRMPSPPEHLQQFVTQHELSSICKLRCIEDIRVKFCKEMRLASFALYIASFSRGSVIITWYVTAEVARMFSSLLGTGQSESPVLPTDADLDFRILPALSKFRSF